MNENRIPPQIYVLWVFQSLSLFGSSVMFFAMNVWLTQVLYPHPEQGDALARAITLAALVFILPHIVLGPWAGVLADRFNRGRIMLVCDLLSGLLATVVAAGMFTGVLNLPQYLLLGGLMGCVGAVHGMAYFTVPPLLAGASVLARISGLFRSTWSMANLLAPMFAAALISVQEAHQAEAAQTLSWAILLDAITFLLAGLVMLFVKVPDASAHNTLQKEPLLQSLKPAWTYILSQKFLLQLFTLVSLVGLLYAPVVVTYPLVARHQVQGFDYSFSYATLNVLLALGGMLGGFLTFLGKEQTHWFRSIVLPMIGVGVGFLITGSSTQLWGVGAGVLLSALMVPIYGSHYYALWQKAVPQDMQGRVFGLLRVTGQAIHPAGIALAGVLTQTFSIQGLMLGSGGLILMLIVLGLPALWKSNQTLRKQLS
ncbi:MFS transporter [Deinococcus cellulosilyticus]|uniref:MFS transporter n=1 Tax=Deinococcus cellulosilyticus (strain DSM 18568 / NBRC 106333 / KACC 11606 / 5516J-15) TaxID=1223518 RepID=A0A511MY94_DEIC1|nr:MFS transporter [Deinococcus cellulosilyticus]GEM45106.1 MFS transporter [Deinococcus cellulosilyticus NBRC 106333 = KACC 11606]